jgi:hypothetical protein
MARSGADYTQEICRCIKFIFRQIKRGWPIETAFNQAFDSYGYGIAFNATLAINKNLNKKA